nr:PREDICTED: trichohyalin [Tribolium castaneum]|eukprot:XP_015837756.1 PREDICTED: trichohyalin [Tribolium castaneum]
MKQLKIMGCSAIVLLLFCLTSTDGFLETRNSRNFFGSIWQRSLRTSDGGREPERFIETLRSLPHEKNRVDQIQLSTGDARQLDKLDSRRRLTERILRNEQEIRTITTDLKDRRDTRATGNRRTVREVSSNRIRQFERESRQIRSLSADSSEFRQLNFRDRQERREVNNLNDRRREVRSVSSDRIRESQQLNSRDSRTTDSSRRQLDDRDLRRVNNLSDSRRETRSISSDRIRTTEPEPRQLNIRNARERREVNNLNDRRREVRSVSSDRIRKTQQLNIRDSRTTDSSRRQLEKRDSRRVNNLSGSRRKTRSISSDRIPTTEPESRELNIQERREVNNLNDRRVSLAQNNRDRRLSDATRHILTLSPKDENNNFARTVQTPTERRMATSFTHDIDYIPELKSSVLLNTIKAVLLSFLLVQVVSNSSKSKKTWFSNLSNFVTVTKDKVL